MIRQQALTVAAAALAAAVTVTACSWIEDETRELTAWRTAPTVAAYVADAAAYATIDRWDGEPAPLILFESRSLAGTLHSLAALYACPIASTNGQARGFLHCNVFRCEIMPSRERLGVARPVRIPFRPSGMRSAAGRSGKVTGPTR